MQQQHRSGPLIAEPHESHERHVLLRHRDEPAPRAVGGVPLAPDQLLVLATPGAQRVLTLDSLPGLLGDFLPGISSIWLGVGGLGARTSVAQGLARSLGIEVVAPDGGVAAMPGAALYAGYGSGGLGWHRYHPEQLVEFHGARFPLPDWESWFPSAPVSLSSSVALPVPCGLLVGAGDDAVFDVPVNQRFPKIVVATSVIADVAALITSFPPHPLMVVPAVPEAATHAWQIELALRVSRDIVFSAGPQDGAATFAPGRGFRPFPVVLRQYVQGGDQAVLAVAPPPPGWQRSGPLSYRLDGVVADVVPSGLVLRSADGAADPDAGAAPYDPSRWNLVVGVRGEPAGLPVLAAAERLLETLTPEHRRAVRVRLAGVPDQAAEHALGRDGAFPAAFDRREPGSVVDAPELLTVPPPVPMAGYRADQRQGRPVPQRPPGPSQGQPVIGAAMPMGGGPVAPVPGYRPGLREGGPVVPSMPQPPVGLPPARPVAGSVTPVPVGGGSGVPAPEPMLGTSVAEQGHARDRREGGPRIATMSAAPVSTVSGPPSVRRPDPVPEAELEPEAGETTELPETKTAEEARPVVVPMRASTAAEQSRFVEAAGEAFGEALATVNAALATWPSMRAGDSPSGKADYVAVCLYLGRGDGGARVVNDALRSGGGTVLDGQVPCLTSGLRKLPTHRRAVLRQGKVDEALEHRSTPGTVLTEPGFLAASTDLDVAVPGADLDVLIWPASARRTGELVPSRPIGEAVFAAGARFKALAVRSAADEDGDEPEIAAPKIAVLFRELAPGETPEGTGLDERDLAVLAKLDTVLARRQKTALRLVEDPETIARLTTSMLLAQDARGRTTAVAS